MKKNFLFAIGMAIVLSFFSCSKDDEVIDYTARDKKIIQDYFEANNITDTIVDASGVYVDVITEGTGVSPTKESVVRIKYEIYTLPENKLFEESTELIKLELSRTLLGLKNGIPYMKKGGVADIYIPSQQAFYGSSGSVANKVIRFKITLSEVTNNVNEMDDIIIQEYFAENEITDAIKDQSGMYIKHITEGTGDSPNLNSNVKVKYELFKLPSDTKVPQENDPIIFTLRNLIKGWQIGIPYMKKGGSAYLYIPSSLAYRGTSNSLANEVLKFKITLMDF